MHMCSMTMFRKNKIVKKFETINCEVGKGKERKKQIKEKRKTKVKHERKV